MSLNTAGPAGTLQALLASNPARTPSVPDRLDALEAGHADHEGRIAALEAAHADAPAPPEEPS